MNWVVKLGLHVQPEFTVIIVTLSIAMGHSCVFRNVVQSFGCEIAYIILSQVAALYIADLRAVIVLQEGALHSATRCVNYNHWTSRLQSMHEWAPTHVKVLGRKQDKILGRIKFLTTIVHVSTQQKIISRWAFCLRVQNLTRINVFVAC